MPELNRRSVLRAAGITAVGAVALPSAANAATADETPVITVRPRLRKSPVSPYLTGVNNNKWYGDANGMWDPAADAPEPGVAESVARTGIGLIRYPGGTSANLFDWKRAIGPQDERECQVDASAGAPVDSRYGPDEHMRFLELIGADAQIMVPFAGSTPADIADWVAYLNSSTGPWARLRAANGHPEPYHVRYWEIGNEIDRTGERYWLSADSDQAMRQYAFGGTQRQLGQPVGTRCDHRSAAAVSSGAPGQQFTVWYPPVVPESQIVYVGGTPWQPIAELSQASGTDEVYEIDPATGAIGFGDGTHGAIPPAGGAITADYDSGPHAGFLDFYRAMKAADPDIDVLASWAPVTAETGRGGVSFPQLMAEHGHAADYDGMTIHPYTNFARDFGITGFSSDLEGHDDHMLGEAAATQLVEELLAEVRKYAPRKTYVALSEFGALFFGAHDASIFPEYNTAMSHVLYMASQWARYADLGLPWVIGNTLVSDAPTGLRAVLGGAPQFVYTAEAVAREQLAPIVHGGGYVVGTDVYANPVVSTHSTPLGSSYSALTTTATIDRDGGLHIVVVNRSPLSPVAARIVPAGFDYRLPVEISVVSGASFASFNSAEHPHDVTIEQRTLTGADLTWTFAAHSVTVLRLRPR
ncbi:MAG TPA: hypothetical protein VHC49_20660 [Mycobacteriales bacterium]|nr:hypothetical protein [Mycobacteriales bacterium]